MEVEYVPQKVFDLQIDDIKYRTNTERERINDRLDKFEAVIGKNFADMKTMLSDFRVEMKDIKGEIKEVRGEIKALDGKIDGVNKRVDGLEKRFDDMKEYQNKWFSLFGILFTAAAILAPVAVAIVQKVVK